ncbi:S-layer protein [Nostoc piscinale CENA21]|uniref:S-layer protein n=1 Tax=Nostoc piscinale CENA21 TaxID=224013 RepID=A0A0M3V4V8_9NOSO|nr:S-layer homology domain-containing protein [Nostoc piscinale]ALF52813.1 S-layer protein [Nostoc piscinale CENA21]
MRNISKYFSTISLVVLLQSFPINVQAQSTETPSQTSSDSIQQVIAAKWMTNSPDGNFHPERLLNRAELASIMVKVFRLDKRPSVNQENVLIADVPASNRAFNDIQIVLKTDIMKGYRGNLFFPNQRVNRAEALAIFAQAYGVFQFDDDSVNEILASHPDATSIPTWARRAIATVVSEGFVKTDSQGNLSPLQPMTRGDMAYVLSKYLQRQQKLPDTPEVPTVPDNTVSP